MPSNHLEEHFGALFARPLLDPRRDVQGRLADLAASDVDLGAVPEQRLHHRRLPGLHRQVQRSVIVLRWKVGRKPHKL